jgi:tetratricopeptide (TPR) repeat protein
MSEMRIPAASKFKEANTPAERLREHLKRLEALLGKLAPNSNATEARDILRHFDHVADLTSQLESTGMDLAAERTRVQTISEQTKRKAELLVKVIGGASRLKALRQEHAPAPNRWWWFLDEYLQEQRGQRRQQVLRTVGIGATILIILGLLYNLLLAPDPETRARYELEMEAERALLNEEATTALVKVNEALDRGERTPDLLILKGVVHQEIGESEKAETAFTEAQQLIQDTETFYLTRSQIYLRLGKSESALADTDSALEANPDSAYSYYLKGTALMGLDQLAEAEESLEKASELAAAQDNAQLQGMARVQIANLSMMIDAPATQTETPESK